MLNKTFLKKFVVTCIKGGLTGGAIIVILRVIWR